MKTLITNAIDRYDGFGTKEIKRGQYKFTEDNRNKDVYGAPVIFREVQIEDRDYEWQTIRYFSGNFFAILKERLPEFVPWFLTTEIKQCPICGEKVKLGECTKDGRFTGECHDAFTIEQWEGDE